MSAIRLTPSGSVYDSKQHNKLTYLLTSYLSLVCIEQVNEVAGRYLGGGSGGIPWRGDGVPGVEGDLVLGKGSELSLSKL